MKDSVNKPILYLKKHLDVDGDFLREWKELTEEEKLSLKEYAVDEIQHLSK